MGLETMELAVKSDSAPAARVAAELAQIASEYPLGKPRHSLQAVERLRSELSPATTMLDIGVVGTNGKTSTATYLARLLTASAVPTGLYVSPHLSEWTERVRLDDVPCDPEELLGAVREVHARAGESGEEGDDLRFFDVLTLAAESIFDRGGVSAAVFEAGIGGRLDAIHAVEPRLVLLTGVATDHAELLGEELSEILMEKLLVAPAGATVLSFPLGGELNELAESLAAEGGFQVVWVDPAAEPDAAPPAYLRSALTLAQEGRRFALDLLAPKVSGKHASPNGAALPEIDLRLPGRLEQGERNGVPYLLDAAHNEAAWLGLAAELRRRPPAGPTTILFSVSPGKRREGLVPALRSMPALGTAIVTRHTPLPAENPERVAGELGRAGLEASAVDDFDAAARLAFERAGRNGGGVLVFGSTHLVGDVRRWLAVGSVGDYE